ncbi:MAG: HD domain-containing phosphohydrolase [bacterium]
MSASGTSSAPHLHLVNAATPQSTEQLIDDAQTLEREGRRSEARAHFESALRALPAPDAARASTLLRWIALSFERESDYAAAEDTAEAALAVAECSDDHAIRAHALNVLGVIRWRQGALDAAEDLLRSALAHGAQGTDPRVLSHAHTNLGTIASVRGDFREALRYFQEALALGRMNALPENILPTLINLGVTNMALSRLDAADEAFSEAARIADALGGLSSRILIDINHAALEVARHDYPEATRRCDRAMALSQHLDDPLSFGEAQKVYGVIARETADFIKAESHLLEARRVATRLGDLALRGETCREMADLYARMGRNRETLQALNEAHACFDQLRSRHELADVARRMTRLESDFLDVVREWGESIESKDLHTQGHCVRVADLATNLAGRAGLDEGTLFWFRIGALLHDVGKLIIPADVLNKPSKLSDDEWVVVQRHPAAGVEMLADVEFPWDISPMVRSHHERWDGRGYPDGLCGEDIPISARILCVADVYDALTSARSYKRAFTHLEAMEIMRREVGTQFDPQLFPLFEALVRDVPVSTEGRASALPPRLGTGSTRAAVAMEDDLTGALMRRAFIDVASAVLAERRRTNGITSLLVMDVDTFKSVNDTLGHLSGDDALRAVVEVAQRHLRAGQYVGRYAGDEFVVLLPGVNAQGAVAAAEVIRAGVAATLIPHRDADELPFGVTLSIGVATAHNHGGSFEELFAAGDRALFESKRDGRNQVVLAGSVNENAPRLSFARFVGRQPELRTLVNALNVASDGSPQLRLLVGEGGVGKSTLVRQLMPELRLRGTASAFGRAFESDSPPPYGPWSELVANIDAQGMTPSGEWPILSALVPTLATDGQSSRAFDPAQGYQMLRELVRYLQQVSAGRPLLIVLEDMHWSDSASWDALEYVMAQLTTERICITATVRSEEASIGMVQERRQRISRDERAAELLLARLTADEISEILEAAMQHPFADPALLDFVLRHTEGNAFLVMQLLGAMIEEGVFALGPTGWQWTQPTTVRLPKGMVDLVARRLNRLQPDTMKVLAYAAAFGRRFSLEFVAAAGRIPFDTVLDAVDDALAASVIEPPADSRDDHYQFAHALLVDAVLRGLNAPRRRAAHERIGDLLSEKTPAAINAIASQYAKCGNQAKAYRSCRLAAGEALKLYALEEARSLLELALGAAASDTERVDVHEDQVRVAELSGRWADVEQVCDTLLASPTITGTPGRELSARLRRLQAKMRLGLGVQDAELECRDLVERARGSCALGDIVQTRSLLVQLLARKGEMDEAISIAEESQHLAEEAGDEGLVADAMYRRAITVNVANPADAVGVLEELIKRVQRRGDRVMEARARLTLGVARSRTEGDTAAASEFRIALSLAQDAQALDVAANASMNLGVIEVRYGAFERAQAALREAMRLYTTLRNNANRLVAIYNLGNVERERGSTVEAARLYAETVLLARELGADDIIIGACAGEGLCAMRLSENAQAATSLAQATQVLGDRADWWFQGRELLESLAVRVLMSKGQHAEGIARFRDAVPRLEAMESYAVAWFVADCGAAVIQHEPSFATLINRLGATATAHQFIPIAARFTALRDMVERPSRSTGSFTTAT